jgi:hypothetical protein
MKTEKQRKTFRTSNTKTALVRGRNRRRQPPHSSEGLLRKRLLLRSDHHILVIKSSRPPESEYLLCAMRTIHGAGKHAISSAPNCLPG